MATRWKILLGAAVALLALRMALPAVLVRVIEREASAQLGRAVALEDVDLFLLAGRITLEELLVGPPLEPGATPARIDPASALVHWPLILVDVGWLGFLKGELRVQRVEGTGARERLVLQADKRLEPLVVARPQASEPPSEAEEPTEPALQETEEVPPPPDPDTEGDGWPLVLEQVTLRDHAFFLIDAADPTQPPVEFSLAELTVADVVLASGQVSVGPVGIRGPNLRVLRGLRIATDSSAESEELPTEPEPAGERARAPARRDFRLASFAIEDARFALLLEEGEFEVTLDLSVRDASLAPDARFPVEIRLTREKGWLEVAGKLGLAPIAFSGTVRWEDFPVVGLIAAANPEIPLDFEAGSVAGDLQVDLENVGAAEPGRASVRGRVAVEELALRHDDGLLEVDCQALAVVAEKIEVPLASDEPPELTLASIQIAKPAVKLVRRASPGDGAEQEPPVEEAAPASEASASGSGGPRIAIGELEVKGGSFQLLDESVEPTAGIILKEIDLEGSELRHLWHPTRSGHLEADLQGLGGLSIALSGDWREGTGTTSVALRDLALRGYSPYLAKATGFEFERGSASLDAKIESAGRRHEVDADLTLKKIALDDVEEGAFERLFGVSAPMAVSLLTDARGNIGLPVDFTLEEGRADIDLAALLIGALRQSLTAVLAAPLKGLGLALRTGTGLLKSEDGGIELDPLELEPGSSKLAPDQLDQLGLVASGLATRPDLGLALSGRVGKEDQPFLRAQALMEQIEAGDFTPLQERGLLERRRLRGGLERRVRLEPDELAPEEATLLERWISDVKVPRQARDRLAGSRAEAARSVLVDTHGLDAARLRIGKPREGRPGVAIDLFVTSE